MEDAGAATYGGGDGVSIKKVGMEDHEAVASAREREEVGGIEVGEDKGVDYGVAFFQK
ncbi:hypothetical protein PanWU01x14_310850, partial [Parasponia andersonii]